MFTFSSGSNRKGKACYFFFIKKTLFYLLIPYDADQFGGNLKRGRISCDMFHHYPANGQPILISPLLSFNNL